MRDEGLSPQRGWTFGRVRRTKKPDSMTRTRVCMTAQRVSQTQHPIPMTPGRVRPTKKPKYPQ